MAKCEKKCLGVGLGGEREEWWVFGGVSEGSEGAERINTVLESKKRDLWQWR